MANTVQFDDGSIVEYDIRVPKREELQRVIDLVNADDWNMSVDILTDIYDVQTDGFRVAVDKQGNILCKHVQNLGQPFLKYATEFFVFTEMAMLASSSEKV